MKRILLPLLACLILGLVGCAPKRTPVTFADATQLRAVIAEECGIRPADLKKAVVDSGQSGKVFTVTDSFAVPLTSCRAKTLNAHVSAALSKWGKFNSFSNRETGWSRCPDGRANHRIYFGDRESHAFVDVFINDNATDADIQIFVKVVE